MGTMNHLLGKHTIDVTPKKRNLKEETPARDVCACVRHGRRRGGGGMTHQMFCLLPAKKHRIDAHPSYATAIYACYRHSATAYTRGQRSRKVSGGKKNKIGKQ